VSATTATIPSGWVNVISKNSNQCLDVVSIPQTNYGKNQSALVQQYTCWGGDMQKWQFTPVGSGYEITSKNSGLQLDVIGGPGATQDGVLIQQWPYWGGTNQIWNVTPTQDGYFTISPQNSGKCLDVIYTPGNNWGLSPGTLVQQWDCWGGPNQEWKIVPAQQANAAAHVAVTPRQTQRTVSNTRRMPAGL
jgi:glucosylceramidase